VFILSVDERNDFFIYPEDRGILSSEKSVNFYQTIIQHHTPADGIPSTNMYVKSHTINSNKKYTLSKLYELHHNF
jgi:hypothetical protein